MKRVAVLGASGMLGSMLATYLSKDPEFEVLATVRDTQIVSRVRHQMPTVRWEQLDAEAADISTLVRLLRRTSWVINAIGVIKPHIDERDPASRERAIRVNSLFPSLLVSVAEHLSLRVIQIATDCVFSGSEGNYVESDPHDALDVYGKTKSLGEVPSQTISHLRCSIIGPELQSQSSLLEWFRGQPRDSSVKGFRNHLWNGVTTLHFAKLCAGLVREGLVLPQVQHVVPADAIAKSQLLEYLADGYSRQDIRIEAADADAAIDRTLATNTRSWNRRLWVAAGYDSPPTVESMVRELAAYGQDRGLVAR